LKISIINESKKKAITFDRVWLRAYFSPEICPKLEEVEYSYLAPTVLIKDEIKQDYVEAKSSNLVILIKFDKNR
jgi:hypothetical protein